MRDTLPILVLLTLVLRAEEGVPPARTDLYGDPLPEGAVMRLGVSPRCAREGMQRSPREWLLLDNELILPNLYRSTVEQVRQGLRRHVARAVWSHLGDDDRPIGEPPVMQDILVAEILGRTRVSRETSYAETRRLIADAVDRSVCEPAALVERFLLEDPEYLGVLAPVRHRAAITRIDVSEAWDMLVSYDEEGVQICWDLATGIPLWSMDSPMPGLHRTPSSNRRAGDRVADWDFKSGTLWQAHSRHDRLRAGGTYMGSVLVEETQSRQALYQFQGHDAPVRCVVFSADSSRLVSGDADGMILVWDLARTGPRYTLAACWKRLASVDAREAFEAGNRMRLSGDHAVDFLREQLFGALEFRERVQELVERLDDEECEERERAMQRLIGLGEAARPSLRERLLDAGLSPETRVRIRVVLMTPYPVWTPERLQVWRAFVVLEQIDPSGAHALLLDLARGSTFAWETHLARECLARQGVPAREYLGDPH